MKKKLNERNMSYCMFENTSSDLRQCNVSIEKYIFSGKEYNFSSDFEKQGFKDLYEEAERFIRNYEDYTSLHSISGNISERLNKSLKDAISEAIDSAEDTVNVGTIFMARDNYNDNTNWYRVTQMIGAKSVKLERLQIKYTSGGGYVHSGECVPDLEAEGTPLRKTYRLNGNSIRISDYVRAYIWHGENGTYDFDR